MKNTSTAFKVESSFKSDTNHNNQILQHPAIDHPVYLKDGLQKYHYFIEEQRINIEQLRSLKLQLQATGKICPKAWHWGRFYKLFHPMHESFWLTTWWETTDDEKRVRFNEQLNYLAKQTIRFRDAYKYLLEIEDRNWHFKTIDRD
ncbi:MAG: hypothetical protein ACI9ZT_001702 [Gammaproteobacteria bacterium]|jgi:hypothetical protein